MAIAWLERQYWATVTTIKHEAFEPESELRIVVFAPPVSGFVLKRNTSFADQEYIRLARAADDDVVRYDVPRALPLPISEIKLGPQTPAHREDEINSLLAKQGYRDVKITKSKAPFRSR